MIPNCENAMGKIFLNYIYLICKKYQKIWNRKKTKRIRYLSHGIATIKLEGKPQFCCLNDGKISITFPSISTKERYSITYWARFGEVFVKMEKNKQIVFQSFRNSYSLEGNFSAMNLRQLAEFLENLENLGEILPEPRPKTKPKRPTPS